MPADEPAQIALGEAMMRIMIDTAADVSVEDLGTVPDFVRASIARLGLPGYKVLRWEPMDPTRYPAMSVAMTGTHDTDTLAVWWETMTPDDRERFAAYPVEFDASVRDTILELMYNAGSNLLILPLQDVFGWRDRINHPATIGEENWTYALPWAVDELTHQPQAVERANRLAAWSQRTGRWNPRPETDD
jgi:4-alpha-glucanotransferase